MAKHGRTHQDIVHPGQWSVGKARYRRPRTISRRTGSQLTKIEKFLVKKLLVESLDRMVKNGKYLTDTQLKYVLTDIGLSSQALVNAPDVDAPSIEEGAIVETQKLEFFREFTQKAEHKEI